MPYYTVVIESRDPARFVPGSWKIEVRSRNPVDILTAARDLCLRENVKLVRVVSDDTHKEVKA